MNRSAFLCLSAAVVSACAGADAGPTTEPPRGDLADALARPRSFAVQSEGSLISVTATNSRVGGGRDVVFTIADGSIGMRAGDDGLITLDEMSLELADVTVSPELFPPDGLSLRELRVHLDYPVVATPEWSADGRAAMVDVSIDNTLDWSAEFDGGRVYPLRSIELEDLPLHVDLAMDGSEVRARLSAARSGPFWEWAGMFDLADLVMDLDTIAD